MTDFYMNFNDLETFETFEGEAPFEYGIGGVVGSAGWDIDLIGPYAPIKSYDKYGVPKYGKAEGYYLNLRSDLKLPDELDAYRIYPENPIRVWA